ncbi:MAG: hypothetical protein BWK80_48425, partial [Desulfobacteraceae bacterium IS3]
MTAILGVFFAAFVLSLILTPLAGKIAYRYNLLDLPSERKLHSRPLPRIGGIAIYLAFFLSLLPLWFGDIPGGMKLSRQMIYLILGASLAFGLGFADDLRPLGYRLKFAVQIISASLAYWGGIKIYVLALPGITDWRMGLASFPVTVLWFVLVINAINLTDGLDGLAAGLTLFASMVLLLFCVNTGRFTVATALAALGGASLGFLRYNFNPASVFMGDGG